MAFCPRCETVMEVQEVVCPKCGHRLTREVVYRPDFSPQEILDLGLSPKFVEFALLDPKPDGFEFWCDSRHAGWACFVPEDVSRVYPLWSCNADVTALWMRCGRLEFVKLYHDDPEWRVLARTEQGLLLDLFRALLESEDWLDPKECIRRLQKLADVAGFHHLSELNEWHQRNGGSSEFQELWDRLVDELDKHWTKVNKS